LTKHLLVSYHTCPMEEPGEGLAGGMNIFLRGLLKGLGAAGMPTDVVTRAEGETVEVTAPFPGVRIFHVPCSFGASPTRESAWKSLGVFVEKSRLLLQGERIRRTSFGPLWMTGVADRKLSPHRSVLLPHGGGRKARSGGARDGRSRCAPGGGGCGCPGGGRRVFFHGARLEENLRIFPAQDGKSFVLPPGVDERSASTSPGGPRRPRAARRRRDILFAARRDSGKNMQEALDAFRSSVPVGRESRPCDRRPG
jgi:D-inositol-3-phosphate glycosyltransferase